MWIPIKKHIKTHQLLWVFDLPKSHHWAAGTQPFSSCCGSFGCTHGLDRDRFCWKKCQKIQEKLMGKHWYSMINNMMWFALGFCLYWFHVHWKQFLPKLIRRFCSTFKYGSACGGFLVSSWHGTGYPVFNSTVSTCCIVIIVIMMTIPAYSLSKPTENALICQVRHKDLGLEQRVELHVQSNCERK